MRRTATSCLRALGFLTALAAAGCLTEVPDSRPAMISVEADDTTPSAGTTVRITFNASGTGITRVTVDLGDGTIEEKTYSGPTTVTDFVEYSYAAAGTYTVTVELTAVSGIASATVELTVT